MTTREDFLAELTDVLELESDACMDDEFRDYDEWDSLMFLSMVTHLRDSYGLELTPELFETIDTWEDIYNKLPQ